MHPSPSPNAPRATIPGGHPTPPGTQTLPASTGISTAFQSGELAEGDIRTLALHIGFDEADT